MIIIFLVKYCTLAAVLFLMSEAPFTNSIKGVYLNPFRHGLSEQRLCIGGPKRHPFDIWLLEDIFINFLIHLSLFGWQGLESKNIAPYMKNCNSQNCLKNRCFWQISKKMKMSTKIKPRHIGCSSFFLKGPQWTYTKRQEI